MYLKNNHRVGESYPAIKEALLGASVEDLAAIVLNARYNDFVSSRADYENDAEEPQDASVENGRAHGKRVPYIGWFWRDVDWFHKDICIGDCGDFIGVMENNKWDYKARALTEAEVDQVIAIVDAAMAAARRGGIVSKIHADMRRELERLWPLFQTFAW